MKYLYSDTFFSHITQQQVDLKKVFKNIWITKIYEKQRQQQIKLKITRTHLQACYRNALQRKVFVMKLAFLRECISPTTLYAKVLNKYAVWIFSS